MLDEKKKTLNLSGMFLFASLRSLAVSLRLSLETPMVLPHRSRDYEGSCGN